MITIKETLLYSMFLYYITSSRNMIYDILNHIILYHTVSYYSIMYGIISCDITINSIISSYIILDCIMLNDRI